ncbi:MAG: hypothetical protein V4864_12715 [Pseudomonadota bacterium]
MFAEPTAAVAWIEDIHRPLDRASLDALLRNEIPFIRIKRFAPPAACEALVARACTEGFSVYRDVEPKINRIGNTVFEYNHISRGEYFRGNIETRAVQARIFAGSFDPVAQFLALLRAATRYPARIARGDGGEDYYAGLVRRIESGTLVHIDFAPAEQSGWEVGRVKYQLSWNLYLRTTPGGGGRTHVYNRQWMPGDDRHRQGSYGFDPRVVGDAEKATFDPEVGEIVIFNTRNFHCVEETRGERVTVASAIGMLPNNELVLWS